MEKPEIRLRILQTVVPIASRHDLTNPEQIVKIATALEGYVTGTNPPGPVAGATGKGNRRKQNRADKSVFD